MGVLTHLNMSVLESVGRANLGAVVAREPGRGLQSGTPADWDSGGLLLEQRISDTLL